jgi:trehalose-6-phosphate synthase
MCASYGVGHKIEASERFLKKSPEFPGKGNESIRVSDYVSHVSARHRPFLSKSRCKRPRCLRLGRSRQRGAFGADICTSPIVFLHTLQVTFSQFRGLLTVADAFLVTSLWSIKRGSIVRSF